MSRLLASLVLFLVASPLAGQINLAPEQYLGQRIVATAIGEAKNYDWSCPTADILSDGGSCLVWAKEGKHTLTLITVDADYKIRRFEQDFEVNDSPIPPTPVTLRSLVSDSEAQKIAEYLRALADQVSKIESVAQFWSVWDQTFPVKGNAKLDAALKARLDPAIERQKGLSVVLVDLAAEFEAEQPTPPKPEPTPIVQGKRQVIVAYNTNDTSPDLDMTITHLRKPGTAAQAFLTKGGHVLDVLDRGQIADSKWQSLLGGKLDSLPKLFIIDPQTNAILFEQTIANGTTADNIVERIRETGGR